MITYPLSHKDITPGNGFKRMGTSTRPDGLPDGVHTGGCWLSPDGTEVWKPLDCKPFVNATERIPTDEDKCLAEMDGKPGFLKRDKWHIETANARKWLVLPRMYFWPQDRDVLLHPLTEDFLVVERALMALNAAGWEYNDLPQLAYHDGDPYLVDFSAAHKPVKWQHGWHGDGYRMSRWWELMERPDIAELRQRGGHIHHAIQCPEFCDKAEEPFDVLDRMYPLEQEERRQYAHIYASIRRPMSSIWAGIEGVKYLTSNSNKRPFILTWAVSNHLLDEKTIQQYELTWAWSPWP